MPMEGENSSSFVKSSLWNPRAQGSPDPVREANLRSLGVNTISLDWCRIFGHSLRPSTRAEQCVARAVAAASRGAGGPDLWTGRRVEQQPDLNDGPSGFGSRRCRRDLTDHRLPSFASVVDPTTNMTVTSSFLPRLGWESKERPVLGISELGSLDSTSACSTRPARSSASPKLLPISTGSVTSPRKWRPSADR